ncbi:MAG: TrmB family transcriptional regulator [Candidatus Nanoarchaeia archaeon]
METKILEELGLTAGEIKAYLALLKLGSSSTGPLANESQVSRSKLYHILDKLEKKGLASHVDKSGVTYYQAVEPKKIHDLFRQKRDQLARLEEEFEAFLPKLEAQYEEPGRVQKVTVYQGLKGLMTAHEHTYLKLKKGDEYCYLGIPKFQPEAQHLYWQRDHIRRAKVGIKTRMLFNKDTARRVLANRNSYKGGDARYMPADIKTPAFFLIYKDTVMIAIPSENPLAIEIISQEIADAFMAYFNSFWKLTKKFK